jgi:hypothetical protein
MCEQVEAMKPLDAADSAQLKQMLESRRGSTKTWVWTASFYLCVGLVCMYVALIKWRAHREMKRVEIGLCPSCGYDLRSTPDRCPECGSIPAAKATA